MNSELLSRWTTDLPATLKAWADGELTDAEANRARSLHGLHQQRDSRWMLRFKAAGGRVSPRQLRAMAEAALDWCDQAPVHFTSRQAVELHNLTLRTAATASEVLGKAGWSTRGSGGDGFRNVTVPARAGLEPGDPFDPYPWALAFARYFEGRAEFEALPRKFKVAFTTPAEASPGAWLHDLAFIADWDADFKPGFRVLVGGGLGASPSVAHELRSFVPAHDVLRVTAAVARVWSLRGERGRRHEARMKHLIRSMGFEAFAREVGAMESLQVDPGDLKPAAYAGAGSFGVEAAPAEGGPGYKEWARSNARPQAGGGQYVIVKTKQGQMQAALLRALAGLADDLGLKEVRISQRQQLYLVGVKSERLPEVHRRLSDLGLADPGADTLADVSACPGPGFCNLGLADPRGLAAELASILGHSSEALEVLASLRVSGCANSCCHHKSALLGLEGGQRQQGGRWYPVFRLYVGGGGAGEAALGKAIGVFPAALVGEAIKALLAAFKAGREEGESLATWIRRRGEPLAAVLAPFAAPDPANPLHFKELGSQAYFAPYARGQAQC